MPANTPLSDYPAFAQLTARAEQLKSKSIAAMLGEDPSRAKDFSVAAAGLHLDFSKQLIDRETLDLLLELADQASLGKRAEALFGGEHVNSTEDRPALHMLLRAESGGPHAALHREVSDTLKRMQAVVSALHSGECRGYSGEQIQDVVNIGIGGSDLGPRLVTEALAPFAGAIRCHYVANVDPADLGNTLAQLNPERTMFIICSKSFRTEETLANSLAARQWLLDKGAGEDDLNKHFLAVTTNLEAAAGFGIDAANCLPMWDWVGGRYSVWSAVGLSSAIAIGWDNFTDFLAGGCAMDEHFRQSAPVDNMPVVLALLEIWNCNILGAGNHAVLPYDHNLRHLADYLQQLTMESNGKSVALDGSALDYHSAPVLWGSAGTIGQHSFHQLLHQGTRLCPVDFVLPLTSHTGQEEQHRRLVANCLAQSRALLLGRSKEDAEQTLLARGFDAGRAAELAPHLSMPGNRPNSVITLDALTPRTLGALLALYEHRTFCSGQLWGINPFDQWGVEVGKEIGVQIFDKLSGDSNEPMDASTEGLIDNWRRAQSGNAD